MTDTIVILNPTAGSPEHVRSWQERIESLAGDCPVRVTSHSGEAEGLARRAVEQGFTRIVAAGGDGTVNQVANGLAGSNATLGVLPMGSVNVFAMELGLPLHNLQRCWDIIEDTNVRLVDMPSANEKYFVQLAGVGLDAQVVKETSLAFKRSFGPLSYLISAAQIAARQPPKLFIESEHTSCGGRIVCSRWKRPPLRRPFPFFKQAIIDDGLFDVVVFKRLGYLEIIKYLQDVVFSSDIKVPEIEYFQTRQLRITSEQDVPLELDGELAGNCPVDFRIRKRALRVLAPTP